MAVSTLHKPDAQNSIVDIEMIGLDEITRARDELLERMVTYFSEPSEVLGILLGGSIPSGT
ncbi:MAG: hypothetical protein DRR42_25770, partial [Gammaproteobacteria bacterium]